MLLHWFLISAIAIAVSWIVMIVLAKPLPPGLAKDLASVLPACVTTARTLRKDPRVPRRVKVVVAIAGLWVLSPIDLIPEFLPIIGPLDDSVFRDTVCTHSSPTPDRPPTRPGPDRLISWWLCVDDRRV